MNAQTIANKVWEANGGTPADDLTYQKSTLDNSDNLIIVGNTYTTGQEENVWIVKYDPEGTLLWQYEYNYASNGRDYATNVVTGTNGDIFVTGSIFNAVSNTFDFLTLKLAANGTLLWTATHDANNFDDVAADIALDNNGNIYVTGGSQVSTTDWNYTTIKYNSSGTLLWSQQYDYANLRDVAVNIEVEGNNVIVTGASANTPQEWDYATVHYDDNGILQNTERTASGITGFDQPMDMVQDDNGFIYITGRGTQNGTNYDIQTVKLSSTLNVEWVVNFDGEGFEDGAADLELDAFKNVFIVGLTQNSNLTTDLLVVKYDELGNELWRRTRSSETGNAKATAAKVNPDGSIIVTGEVQNGTQIDFITLKYDATAALQYIDQNHILHFPELGAGSSVTIVPTNTIFSFYQPNHLSSQGNNDFLVLQINEVTITYNHQSYVGSGNVINSWIRNSASEGYESTINVDDLEHKWCELLSANSQQAVTKTYLYKIVGYHAIGTSTANYIPNPTAQWDWWGVSPLGGNPICPYTLVVNGTITNNDEVVVNNENELKIYPIPTHNSVNIEFLLDETTDVMLDIFDLNGQLIKTVLTGQQIKGQHNISVSLDNIPTGIYLCRLQAGNKISTQKIVKIN
jgi:hypothetical protein